MDAVIALDNHFRRAAGGRLACDLRLFRPSQQTRLCPRVPVTDPCIWHGCGTRGLLACRAQTGLLYERTTSLILICGRAANCDRWGAVGQPIVSPSHLTSQRFLAAAS